MNKLINKFSLATLFSSALVLTACSEPKDKAYYQNNPEAAEQKVQECRNQLMAAVQSKDKAKAEELAKDAECQWASEAKKAAQRAKRQAEAEARKAKIQAQRQQALAAAEKQFASEHANIDWKGIIALQAEQRCGYLRKNGELDAKAAMCQVIADKYKALVEPVKAEFSALPFDELLTKEAALCKLKRGRNTPCGVWEASLPASAQQTFADMPLAELASKEASYCKGNAASRYIVCAAYSKVRDGKMKALVKKYATDDKAFTETFNACYDKVQKMKAKGAMFADVEVRQSDLDCDAVNTATYNRNLMQQANFANPLK